MSVLIHDPHLARDYINQRQLKGLDRYDEVWDGVTVVMPLPTIDHQKIAVRISGIVLAGFDFREPPHIFAGVNVSDYVAGWTKNFRCPDVAVFPEHTTAVNCDTHWCGGPDFLIEIASPDDHCREKLPFYASVRTGEVLIIGSEPWQIEQYTNQNGTMQLASVCTPASSAALTSVTMPFTFRLVPGSPRPLIELTHVPTGETWQI